MTISVYPKENAFRNDPAAAFLLDHLRDEENNLSINDAVIFCKFPLFKEESEILSVKFAIISQNHGVILISTSEESINIKHEATVRELDSTFSQVFSRLVKYPRLRITKTTLAFQLDSFLFLAEQDGTQETEVTEDIVVGLKAFSNRLIENQLKTKISDEIFSELISVLDGSKALLRPPVREVDSYGRNSKVAQIAALEDEIRKFDRDQRVGYMTEIHGTQRVRGLAGSGKTVVLAMKAAITLIREPSAKIAFTFYTKSLYQHVKQLITRFYRLYDDKDPDPRRLMILHAWGGELAPGLYSYAAKSFGETPLTFGQAKSFSPSRPFDFACKKLLDNLSIAPIFDYIFVDEAQDFPPSFLRLALKLAEEEKLVIAYDSLQTIFDVDIPTAGQLFGTDERGEASISFDEDIILHRCYRNPKEILVTAHALGFGLYAPRVVQMLESKEHWEDFGYKVLSPELKSGEIVEIERPQENSPSSISIHNTPEQLISFKLANSLNEEVLFVVKGIVKEIQDEGVSPEDILIICADDINSRKYFRAITEYLKSHDIETNNLQDDTYGIRDFQLKSKVTLSTIYKAKGNEGFIVYLVGIDAIFNVNNSKSRNLIFTAMTRAKGWLRISGMGLAGKAFMNEFNEAVSHLPKLVFKYPKPQELIFMKRDLTQASEEEVRSAVALMEANLSPEDLEQIYTERLREIRKLRRVKSYKSGKH
jgi:superfamily I DNA and RNA helicase